jgi:hypothetical protein
VGAQRKYELELSLAEIEVLDVLLERDVGTELQDDPDGRYPPAQIRLELFKKVSALRDVARSDAEEQLAMDSGNSAPAADPEG